MQKHKVELDGLKNPCSGGGDGGLWWFKSRDQNCEVTKEGFWKIKDSSFCPW